MTTPPLTATRAPGRPAPRRTARATAWLVLAALTAVMAMAATAGPASAAKHVSAAFGSTSGSPALGGTFSQPTGGAVRQSTGQYYVFDRFNMRIQRFGHDDGGTPADPTDDSHPFERAWGWDVIQPGKPGDTGTGFEICTVAADCKAGTPGPGAGQLGEATGPQGVAIDQSTGAVYVTDAGNARVQKFDADGGFLRAWGRDVDPSNPGTGAEVCVAPGPCKAGLTGALAGELSANSNTIAVDDTGDVYVGEGTSRRIQKFDSNGNALRAWGWDVVASGPGDAGTGYEICVAASGDVCKAATPTADELGSADPGRISSASGAFLAADSTGRVYASDSNGARVLRFQADGSSPEVFSVEPHGGTDFTATYGPQHVAIDSTDDHVFVAKATGNGSETQVKEYDAAGALVDVHGEGDGIGVDILRPRGLALHEASGRLYLPTTQAKHWVLVLSDGERLDPGEATIQPTTDIGAHMATFHATVNPNGFETTYQFEYSRDGVSWTPVGAMQSAGDGTGDVPVEIEVDGLEANAGYRVRVKVFTVFAGGALSGEDLFETATVAPDVTTGAAQSVTSGSASLRGRVNPNNLPTTYRVEYGTTSGYGSTVPVPDAPVGAGGLEKLLVVELAGLEPGETYHYRFVATNSQGTTFGADRTFATRPATSPGDAERAYEMVTPPDKRSRRGGLDLRVDTPLIGVPSADGESVLFAIRFGIVDPEAGGSVPHSFDLLMRHRAPDGWRSEAVNNVPPQLPSVAGLVNFVGASADLGAQAWHHNEWLFPSGSMLGTRLLGDGGGTIPGSGWYDWLGDPTDKLSGPQQQDFALLAGGGSHMLRWGGQAATYRGLLGSTNAADASNKQLDGPDGGDAVYLQEGAGAGPIDLVNECTGSGATATRVPSTSGGLVGSQACPAGSVTSLRGATAGGGALDGTVPVVGPVRRALSEDGRRVFFTSPDPGAPGTPATCLSTTDCPPQLYVRQYSAAGPVVRWISRSAVLGQTAALLGRGSGYEGASADGGVVYFKTNAPLTPDDPNGVKDGSGDVAPPPAGGVTSGSASDASWDLYRYELPGDLDSDPAGGELTRVSGGPDRDGDSAAGDFDPGVIDADNAFASRGGSLRFLSDGGDRAYFVTRGSLGDAGDPWNVVPEGGVTGPGSGSGTETRNLYLFDASKAGNERWKFVARLPHTPSGDAIDACASHNLVSGVSQRISEEVIGREPHNCVRGTPDGGTIAFETTGQLTGDDDDAAGDIYVYEAAEDRLTRVSAPRDDATGYLCAPPRRCNATFGRSPQVGALERIGLSGAKHRNFAVDGDGRVSLFFESRLPLVPEDQNGSHMDVYEWRDGELSLISPGTSPDGAHYSGNTLDGEDVFFSTSERIDPREIDADFDIYDARDGGGIPLPPPPPAQCDTLGGACQAGGGSPIGSPTQSDGAGGGGNLEPGARPVLRVGRPSARALRRAARRGVVRVGVAASAPGRVRAVATAGLRVRRGVLVRRRVASASLALREAGSGSLRLRLSRAAARQLRAGRPLRVSLRVSQRGARTKVVAFVLRRAGK